MKPNRTDAELMRLYLEGDQDAFHEIYRRYSMRIYGYLRSRLPAGDGAVDDLFQTVFMKLHRSRASYKGEYRFDAWLFTLCHNALVDYFRERSRRADQPGEDEFPEFDLASPDISSSGRTSSLDGGVDELLSAGGVSGHAESALRYRYIDDLTFDEIASLLGMTSGNARQTVSRAVRRIRNSLKK